MTIVLSTALKRLQYVGFACSETTPLSLRHGYKTVHKLLVTCRPYLNSAPAVSCPRTIHTQPGRRPYFDPSNLARYPHTLSTSIRLLHVHHPLSHANSPNSKPPANRKPNSKRAQRQFPFGTFDETILKSIFGSRIRKQDGNEILQTIHSRRVSGELMDVGLKLDQPLASAASTAARESALQWLRVNFPMDEQTAAERWVEREESRLSAEIAEDSERMGVYNPPPPGESVVEQWAQERKKRQAIEKKKREESGEAQRSEDMQVARMEARRDAIAQRKEREAAQIAQQNADYWEKYGYREVPDMSSLARLGPSTLFAAFVICSWVIYSQVYSPPLQSERFFPGVPASVITVGSIIGINALILCLWPVRALWPILGAAFVVEPAAPHAIAMLGNLFSHREFLHFAANMLGLAIYGIPLHEDVGRGNFLAIYVSGGIAGSLFSLYVHALGKRWGHNSRGASGCVMAIMMAWAWTTAQKPAKDPGTFAFSWDVGLYASILLQVPINFMRKARQSLDVFAHLGGASVGLLGAIILTEGGKYPGLWPWSSNNQQAAREERTSSDEEEAEN